MDATIWTYPWDLADEGITEVLSRITDDGGLNSISLAVSYHAGRFLLPHNPKRKVYFTEDGTIYFRPTWDRYKKIKPVVNSLIKEVDILKKLEGEAAIRGIKVVAWAVCLHNTLLGSQYPECTIVNAFGDHYFTSLCPTNPDVRFYLKTLIEDLTTNYTIDIVELESYDFMPFEHGFHHERAGIDLSSYAGFLLALCFCDSCINEAKANDLAIAEIRAFVAENLLGYFESADRISEQNSAKLLDLENAIGGEFGRLLRMRERIIASLIREIKEASCTSSETRIRPMLYADAEKNWAYGIDLAEITLISKEVMALAYLQSPAQVRSAVKKYLDMLSENVNLVVGLQAIAPDVSSEEDLIEKVRSCRALGIDSFSFYNYGLMRLQTLGWIKKALLSV